jgi:RNA polymerase sigma-70 factor (ECF subfamily)
MDDELELRLAGRFEASRPRLRAMAYRMLGSLSDADDALQEAWLHAARATTGGGADAVANLEGWFTTITARVCLDMLRSRKSRREEPMDPDEAMVARDGPGNRPGNEPGYGPGNEHGPEQEAMLADSVGLALLVVLDTLPPAERVAFVLHDTFGLPFGEIAAITGRSPAAARQLASRARRRIQGSGPVPGAQQRRQREVAEAFLAAARGGDLTALISVLDPDVELRADAAASPSGVPVTVRGAAAVAGGARAASARAEYGRVALVNGTAGLVMAPRGRLVVALAFTYSGDKISGIDVIADPARLAGLDVGLLDPAGLEG